MLATLSGLAVRVLGDRVAAASRIVLRKVVLAVALWSVSILAIGFAAGAVASWLATFWAAWQAMLAVAGSLAVIGLGLAIALRAGSEPPPRQSRVATEDALSKVDETTVVLAALATGVLLGRRGSK